MANEAIGYVPCAHCGTDARVTRTIKGHLCISCPDGCEQRFTRNQTATNNVLRTMRPATKEQEHGQGEKAKPKSPPVKAKGDAGAAAGKAAAAGSETAGTGSAGSGGEPAAGRRRSRWGF